MNTAVETLIPAFFNSWRESGRRNAVALIGPDRRLTYPQLFEEVGGLSGRLRAAGIVKGDRVAIGMERSVGSVVALLAVLASGACPCVLEPRLGHEETLRRFAITRMGWLLLDAAHANDPGLAGLPGVKRLRPDELPPAPPYWALDTASDAPGFLLFTSGSSGKPKGVLQSHRGLLLNAVGVVEHTALSQQDRLLHLMPLYHTNGVNNQVLAPLLAGSTVILAERFKADNVPELFARHRPTLVTGVPTMYSRLLAIEFPADAFSSLRMMRCGSAPITEELHRRVEEKFGKPLVISYGLSEATCTSTMNPPARRKIGSVGTVLKGQGVYLADVDGTRIERPGSDGEICISGPSLMLGYVDENSEGKPRAVGEVLHSGDLGRFDEEGYLYITGRIKDVIIRGGENLSPNLIEGVISRIPGVQACCVVRKPDPDLGEVPWAFVVRTGDREGLAVNDERLGAAVQEELSRIHKPAGYVYVDSLPENSVGKVDRKALAARLAT
jgi:acyl-CoA synthetase (AMP-forming)/AMP-acid ligase II